MQHLKKRMLALVLVTAIVLGLAPTFALPAHSTPGSLEGREVISFNNDWRFYPGEWPQANEADTDDSDWLYVNAPTAPSTIPLKTTTMRILASSGTAGTLPWSLPWKASR